MRFDTNCRIRLAESGALPMLAAHGKHGEGRVAGESAREVARRRREKAERLTRVADAYEKGADGERQTAHALAKLPAAGWFVLHDVRWPGKRLANIDHVVIGPGGVFVIDSKAWSGQVEVRDNVLRQNGYNGESAVAGAAEAALAVAEQASGLNPYVVKPVLCFIGQHSIEGWARDVMLCTPGNLVAMLLSRPALLDPPTVRRVLLQLQQSLAAATRAPGRATIALPRPVITPRRRSPRKASGKAGPSVAWRLVSGLTAIVVVLVGIWVLVDHSDDIARALIPNAPSVGSPSQDHDVLALGTTANVPSATNRPRLRITAESARTVHRIGTSPYLLNGERFFGVRLTIVNTGKHAWVSQPGTTYAVNTTSGISRTGFSDIRIREGRVLPDSLHLAPGQRATGYVVFRLPADEPVTAVSETAGPGKPHTVSWRIDRQ